MDLYYNHIVDNLIRNVGINRTKLFNITIIDSKRKFLTEINELLKEGRITKDYGPGPDRFRYSPRVLKIYEFEKMSGFKTAVYPIYYMPNVLLEKELEYIKKGDEPEDCLEFDLQIAGYPLQEKFKFFFECYNDIKLDFMGFNYYLWAEYMDAYIEPQKPLKKFPNILYIDNDRSFAINFMNGIKQEYLPESNWLFFSNTAQAMCFLEAKLEVRDSIDLIITENNAALNGIEFIEAIGELRKEFEEKYIHFNIPIMAFTNQDQDLSFIKNNPENDTNFFYFTKSKEEDFKVVGKVIKSIGCN